MSLTRTLFAATIRPGARTIRRTFDAPEAAQAKVLARIVRHAKASAYGRKHGLETAAAFDHLPVVDYDDLHGWIDRAASGEPAVLSSQPIRFFERTSGSSGAAKLIPYTAGLQRAFARMFTLWADDLFRAFPRLGEGKVFMSVSPSLDGPGRTAGGIPIGQDSDADYLASWGKRLVRPHLAVDPELGRGVEDGEAFLDALCAQLLACPDLEIVSVWNPSLFSVLLERIWEGRARYLANIPDDARRREVEGALSGKAPQWAVVWPRLRLISAWDQASAQLSAQRLRSVFPEVHFQGKGLLATEAPMTVPLVGVEGGVPLVGEVYYEFLDDAGDLLRLDQLRHGETYEIVTSVPGGLLRYRIGDRIRVVGRHERVPTFAFVGRGEATSDLVGEKLHEGFVAGVFARTGIGRRGACHLLPRAGHPPHYELWLDDEVFVEEGRALDALTDEVEAELRRAHHYEHARALGQLGPLRVRKQAALDARLLACWQASGRKLGDMKSRCLLGPDAIVPTSATSPSRGTKHEHI